MIGVGPFSDLLGLLGAFDCAWLHGRPVGRVARFHCVPRHLRPYWRTWAPGLQLCQEQNLDPESIRASPLASPYPIRPSIHVLPDHNQPVTRAMENDLRSKASSHARFRIVSFVTVPIPIKFPVMAPLVRGLLFTGCNSVFLYDLARFAKKQARCAGMKFCNIPNTQTTDKI